MLLVYIYLIVPWINSFYKQDGHLKMMGGYLEFFMEPMTAEMYQTLRSELEELIQNKVTILC